MPVHAPPLRRLVAIAVCATSLLASARRADAQGPGGDPAGAALVRELGCAACHTELGDASFVRAAAPSLASAGDRYRLSYLLAYLRDPTRVRRHIGAARMPDFHLRDDEALALALFLDSRRRAAVTTAQPPVSLPAELEAAIPSPARQVVGEQSLLEGLSGRQPCMLCHSYGARGGVLGPELSSAGARLEREWVVRFLVSPERHAGVPEGTMPALFFQEDEEGGLTAVEPDSAAQILRVADTLEELARPQREQLDRELERVRAENPHVDAARGETIFRALQCASCHAEDAAFYPARRRARAPDLSREGERVKRPWLETYLLEPQPIRPFGVPPGSGSRMPDFGLDEEQARVIAQHLLRDAPSDEGVNRAELSAFDRVKAERLLHEKLPCLGCHRLDGSGGRIGPDLSAAGARLRADFVHSIVRHPSEQVANVVMPRVPMTERTSNLIAGYLAQRVPGGGAPARRSKVTAADAYLSLIENDPIRFAARGAGKRAYLRYCAACHGVSGRADGFNARFLPVRPTAHADAALLSLRPDDTLFDGIFAGGAILGRSHFMPAWGDSLTRDQIAELVGHLRELCACEAPAWSTATTARPGAAALR